MSSLIKNLLIALVLAALIWFGYSYYSGEDPGSEMMSAGSSQASLEAQGFLIKLQQLNEIEISGAIFSDTRFNALVDFRQEISPEQVGRNNPFAPIR